MQKRGVPFKVGSELTAEITKVKGQEFFYTTLFNNKTGKGSFKKIN